MEKGYFQSIRVFIHCLFSSALIVLLLGFTMLPLKYHTKIHLMLFCYETRILLHNTHKGRPMANPESNLWSVCCAFIIGFNLSFSVILGLYAISHGILPCYYEIELYELKHHSWLYVVHACQNTLYYICYFRGFLYDFWKYDGNVSKQLAGSIKIYLKGLISINFGMMAICC